MAKNFERQILEDELFQPKSKNKNGFKVKSKVASVFDTLNGFYDTANNFYDELNKILGNKEKNS